MTGLCSLRSKFGTVQTMLTVENNPGERDLLKKLAEPDR